MSLEAEYNLIKLEKDLREKEQLLQETRTIKFKLWFVARLLWTYVKSAVLSIFLVGFIWIGIYLYVYDIYGRSAGISLLHDPIYSNSYLIATFVVSPLLFVIRRAYIILKEVKLLSSLVSSLRKQIEEKKASIAEERRQLQEEQKRREEKRRLFVENMKKKGLVCFVDRMGRERWGTPEEVNEWKRIDVGLNNRFADYSPREFEKFIAKLFQKMGYEVTLGPYVGDYGADIIAKKDNRRILIQVKKYSPGHLVGNREVRDTLGAIWNKADKAIIVTTSDFTEQAYEQAKNAPIELWNYWTLKEYVEKYLIEETSVTSSGVEGRKPVESEIDAYKEAYPELNDEEAELQAIQETGMDLKDEDDNPNNENQVCKDEDMCEVKQVYFLPSKTITENKMSKNTTEVHRREAKESKQRKCRICGFQISDQEYKAYDGLCSVCWTWRREEAPEKDPVREARRAGLLGADRASTW